MYFIQRAVILSIVLVYVKCQSINDLDVGKAKDMLEKGIGGELDIPDLDLNSTDLPKAEDIEKVLRDKCEKNGAVDAVDLMKEEQENARLCLESFVNVTVLQEELDVAKQTGSMDDVFAKYCKKWPDMRACLDNSTIIIRKCMDKKEEEAFNRTMDIVNDLQEFMCFKDGDRLAMFVAEKGVECVTERKDGIQECLNKTIGARLPDPDSLSAATLPVMLFSNQDCDDFDTIRECINGELEQCEQSTPANIVDAFFKFLKKQLPCQSTKTATLTQNKNSSWSISASSLLVLISFIYVRLY